MKKIRLAVAAVERTVSKQDKTLTDTIDWLDSKGYYGSREEYEHAVALVDTR